MTPPLSHAGPGLATYFHADYVASFYPQATVKAMPVSGFFLNVTNVAGDYVYGTQMSVCGHVLCAICVSHVLLQQVFSLQNSTGGVHQGCIAANPGNEVACILACL